MTESNSINHKPILLELFSGTGSVGRSFRARGWEVFSVDIDANAKPTLVANVLDLQWDALPPEVDCIWASPPCTHYSRARTKAKTPRDLEGSDAIVQKVLDILDFYITCSWFMENPESGLLKGREVVEGLPFQVVDYCKYGKPYRKRTAIWTNTYWKPKQPLCKHDCPASSGSRHTASAQQVPSSNTDVRYSRDELYSIPPALCDEIADYATSRYLRGFTHS
jgi:hypothetical protein